MNKFYVVYKSGKTTYIRNEYESFFLHLENHNRLHTGESVPKGTCAYFIIQFIIGIRITKAKSTVSHCLITVQTQNSLSR